MAFDQKLISQLLDLSRNVEKLSGEVKKNTTVSKDLVKSDASEPKAADQSKDLSKIAEGLKSMDLKGLKDEFKGLKDGLKGIDKLDFKGLENGLKSLDFKGLEKGLKGLDFKGLEQGLKGLDFKGLEQGLKGFDIKGITESFKGITDIKNLDVGGMAKNVVSGGGVKDLISGSIGKIGKGILGRFEEGGEVKKSGPYLVGEGGPEIANLSKNTTIIPNDKTEAILSGKQPTVKNRMKEKNSGKYPSKEEIAAKRSELIASDPQFYSDKNELEDEMENYIQNYKFGDANIRDTFTKEDIAKLGKSANKALTSESPSELKKQLEIASKTTTNINSINKNTEVAEKKQSLFSKLFSKENIKNAGGKIEDAATGLLGGGLIDKFGGTLKESVGSLISKENLSAPFGDIKKNLPSLSNLPSIKSKTESISKAIANIVPKSPIASVTENNPISVAPSSEITKTEGLPATQEAGAGTGESITKKDIDAMLSVLGRIASLLEGPLSISSLDSPIRPDSRRI